jgi:hypothetical protein
MKTSTCLTVLALACALAACASKPAPHNDFGPGRLDPGAQPGVAIPPAPAPVTVVTPEEVKARLVQQKRDAIQQKQELEEESRRLASYQKNLFQVFKLSESAAGFQAKPNALGVYESKSARSGKLRLTLAQLPDSPARLNVGSYTVNLDMLVEYVETRECIAGGCLGKTQKIVRSVPKTVQMAISPKTAFGGSRELSFLDTANAEPNAKNYRTSYANLVLTVRRMTIAPAPRSE